MTQRMFTSADAYDRFMGRYSTLLAPQMADLAGVVAGQRVLDVGCGPGSLTAELVRRVGADHVSSIDPSEPFIAALRERYPGVDARVASAESLPFANATFDAAIAQLVVHFMTDPVAGLREMARVTRPGGTVAACVWDFGRNPMAPFWRAARELDPSLDGGARRHGVQEGDLVRLFGDAGLRDVVGSTVVSRLTHATFDDWWQPLELGVGPVGALVASLDEEKRAWIRKRLREIVPAREFRQEAHAWAARGTVGA